MSPPKNGKDGGAAADVADDQPPTTPTGAHERLDVELGALRLVHGAVLEVEGLVNAAVRHAAQAERLADRAYALQQDHGRALDRLSRAYAEQKGDVGALGKALQALETHIDGTFAGLQSYLEAAGVGRLPQIAVDVGRLAGLVGRVPDETVPKDEGAGLLGYVAATRRRIAYAVAIAGVLGAGGGAALFKLFLWLNGGH